MRDEWIRHQIELCELHVREERQRLEEERQRKAREGALIALSLPELLGEISDQQDEQPSDEQPRRVH